MEQQVTQKKNKRLALVLALIGIGMFGFGYALVPLYNTLCKVLGINGKTGGAVAVFNGGIDQHRTVTVEFIATTAEKLPWKFYPLTKKIQMHPGEIKKIAYFAENDSNKSMTVQAIPSVTPGIAAKYLKKTECFCFTQQTLKSHEKMDMPLLFHLDPALPQRVNTVTLSYTLFDVSDMKLKPSKKAGKIN